MDLARAKLAELAAPRADDVADGSDVPVPGISRRWTVGAGPTAATRRVTVSVITTGARRSGGASELTTILRR
jgi:hypothetical protein